MCGVCDTQDDDSVFYSLPRLVYHQDHESIGRLTNLYAELLPECGDIADIMSSWTSHLPEQAKYSRVVGIGMNRAELLSNPRLDEARVQDLNADPAIALPSAYADAVTIASGMQYLTRPEEVLADVRRVLRDTDSKLVLSWTDNFFPSKATRAWRERDAEVLPTPCSPSPGNYALRAVAGAVKVSCPRAVACWASAAASRGRRV